MYKASEILSAYKDLSASEQFISAIKARYGAGWYMFSSACDLVSLEKLKEHNAVRKLSHVVWC